MTSKPLPRRRDAAASRERLLRAAAELFADRGFEQSTARDIGQRAGVDPTMIARYFGGKAQLYIAVLQAEDSSDAPADIRDRSRLAGLVDRFGRQGPGAILPAAVRPYDDPAAQAAAAAALQTRLIDPLRQRLAHEGEERPDLLAELLVAAFIGVVISRHAGTFEHLARATTADVLSLLDGLLGAG
ncbi:TetR/AcrR family transcriptional regulator [Pseudonocardia alaniniphila]|uniref:TetR/AcrR family transcriptional regulator n=2 Tax=Pseudonocardia alaniniphila TaxID=75291 RepID=A0ABS9TPA6_9PSEU|nr:TetR/AcrR family transcriptional regulator [Pseudonocardia alaniniphila]